MALSEGVFPPKEPLTSMAMTSVERATRGLSPAAAEHPTTAPRASAAVATVTTGRRVVFLRENLIRLSSALGPLACAFCPSRDPSANGGTRAPQPGRHRAI